MEILEKKKRFTYSDVMKMYNIGILDRSEPIEILHGEIFKKNTDDTLYELTLDKLKDLFFNLISNDENLKKNFMVSVHNQIYISEENIPLPDIAIVNTESMLEGSFPKPSDVEMIVEISEINHYTGIKLSLYRKYRVKQVLVIDPKNYIVEFHKNMGEVSCIREKRLESKIEIFNREIPIAELLP